MKDDPEEPQEAELKAHSSKKQKANGKKKETTSTKSSTRKSPRGRPKKTRTASGSPDVKEMEQDADEETKATRTKTTKKRKSPAEKKQRKTITEEKTPTSDEEVKEGKDSDGEEKGQKKKRKKPVDHQRLTERDEIPKLWNAAEHSTSHTFKIGSWNVAGLRALMKNHPDALSNLVEKENLDVLCLQETKLQEAHLDDPKLKIRGHLLEEQGYDSYYSCSTARKGYSGTAMFIKRRGTSEEEKRPEKKQAKLDSYFGTKTKKGAKGEKKEAATMNGSDPVDLPVDPSFLMPTEDPLMKMGKEEHDKEGRLITAHFPLFSICNVYVPNSGQKLERLEYRTENWDKDFLAYMQCIEKERGVPVMWLGDLNVAHTNLEVWNDGAKHLAKQAGVTAQERASFQAMLDSGFVDSFRRLHPDAKGHYSYWSQRAGNREPNKGLRLDYFIASPTFFEESRQAVIRDSYMLSDVFGSDHCPVVIEVEIKDK